MAQSYVSEIQRLQEAGARHNVVFNLPDAGATLFAQSVPDPHIPPMLTALTNAYNETLDAGLGPLDDGVSGAALDSDTTVGSLHGTWRMGPFT